MSAFGDRSYFYHLDRQQIHGIPIPKLPDDECRGDDEDREPADELEGLEFAEQGDAAP